MSPLILAVPAIEPSQLPLETDIDGGFTSATGWPNRVTRSGFRVFLTRSNTSRQVALNFEIAISSIQPPPTRLSRTMVNNYGLYAPVNMSIVGSGYRGGTWARAFLWARAFKPAQRSRLILELRAGLKPRAHR